MSPTIVGILGHTGRVGSQITKNLINYQAQGLIKLVILHRPSSNISGLPSGVETRVVELEKEEPEKHFDAIKDLNVVMSVISMDVLYLQNPLLDALAKSEALQAFSLAEIGSPFSEAEMNDPKMAFYTRVMARVEGLGLKDKWAIITSGEYMDYLLGFNLLGSNVKENTFKLYKDALIKRVPLATAPYLGAAMAQLTLTDPSKWAGKLIQIYDHAPTGQELIQAFTTVHDGTRTTVTWYSEDDLDQKSDEGDFGALEAMLIRHWGEGALEDAENVVKASGGWREVPRGIKVEPLEDVVKSYL